MKDIVFKANGNSLFPNSGFTLIELVIVVSIIAVLSGISLFALSGARESGRDARRKADLEEIASGLEMYKADCNVYPNSITFGSPLLGDEDPCTLPDTNVYVQAISDDPNTSNHYRYVALPSGCDSADNCSRFVLWASLETRPTPTPASYCTNNPSNCEGTTCNYCVINP